MSRKKTKYPVGGTSSVYGDTGSNLVVLVLYCKLVLLGIRWYRVSIGLVCLYILKKVEIWLGVTDPSHTHRQQNIVLLSLSKV